MSDRRLRPFHGLGTFLGEVPPFQSSAFDFATDVSEHAGKVIVEMQVPGVDPEKINIEVENHQLRVSGSREEIRENRDKSYYRKEIKRGSFEREIHLPCLVDQNNVTAQIKDGILTISLPKQKGKQASKIVVRKKQ